MKKQLFIVIFLGFTLRSQSQNIIKIDSGFLQNGIIKIANQTYFYVDSTHKKTFNDVSNTKFEVVKDVRYFSQHSKEFRNIWFKFLVKNTLKKDTINALLYVGNYGKNVLYMADNQSVKSKKLSRFDAQKPNTFRFDSRYLPIVLAPNKSYTFFVETFNNSLKKINVLPAIVSYDWEAKKTEQNLYDDRFAIAFNYSFIAILAFLSIFTLLQYLLNRQRYFLYYSYYLFSMMTFATWGFVHSPYVVHFMTYLPFFVQVISQNFYILLTQFCYFLFINEFLELTSHRSKITKTIQFLLKSLIVLMLIELVNSLFIQRLDFGFYLTVFTQIYLSVFGIIILFFVYQIRTKLALYIKIGSTCLLLGGIFGFLSIWMLWVPQSSDLLDYYPNAFFNTCILLEILFFSMGLAYKSAEIIHQKNELEQAVSLSELNTLRLQINPHFLFNSLNSIKSYIIKNKTDEAADYLTNFSTLIRSILQKSKEQVVTLKEELDTILLYTKLEQLRFQQKFDFIFEISAEINTEIIIIPALLLQPYIENAIKHGLTNKKGKGTLSLIIKDLEENIEIVIDDDGIGRKRATDLRSNSDGHQSMGLKINEERLKLLNKIHGINIHCQIMDKFDALNEPVGTKIILTIPK